MTASSTQPPKTLREAKELISLLKSRLGLAQVPDSLQPQARGLFPTVAELLSSNSPSPKATPPGALPSPALRPAPEIELGQMPPKVLADFFANSMTSDLRRILSHECSKSRRHQNPSLIASLYKEIRKRKS
jgi:hypothetical protein